MMVTACRLKRQKCFIFASELIGAGGRMKMEVNHEIRSVPLWVAKALVSWHHLVFVRE